MTRVVLDTNVLVAGLLSTAGPPAWIVEALLAGDLEPAFDHRIRLEYDDVLRREEFQFPEARVADLFSVIDASGFLVSAASPCRERLPDPDDEPFLEVAAAANCILVTGNLRHFPVRSRQGVSVKTPREFMEYMRPRSDSGR